MAKQKKSAAKSDFGLLPKAKKDAQSITADWQFMQPLIDGVVFREVRHVPKENGHLTEIWRREWALDTGPVAHVFQVVLNPGGVSGWHTHQLTIDRLFASQGLLKVALYDARKDSPTRGRLNVFRIGAMRPALLIVPPGVWHGVENISSEPVIFLNLTDREYRYEDPDHWRLPADTGQIPYRLGGGTRS